MKKRRLLTEGNLFASLKGSLVKVMALCAVCMFTIGSALAQSQAIRGIVTETNGTPVIGANVMVKGTTVGAITSANGEFSVNAAPGSVLEVSFIGYETVEVNAVAGQTMDIKLSMDGQQIQDVVVVGYGTAKKETLTGAISSITSDDINTTTNTNMAQTLQGKISGLQIRQQSGAPGATDMFINIRGFGQPLYVIDGVIRDSGGGAEFQRLNPNDIESVTVLKDASAAIYGLNAANGVIIVTTKMGKKGKPTFNYDGVFGIQQPTNVPRMASAYEYQDMWNDAGVNANEGPRLSEEELAKWKAGGPGYESTDWFDAAMRDYATQTQHNLSFSGGDEVTNFYVSLGYLREMSLLKSKEDKYERYNFRVKLSTKIHKNLTADFNVASYFDTDNEPNENYLFSFKGTRIAFPMYTPYANNNPEYPGAVNGDNLNPVIRSQTKYSGYNKEQRRRLETTGGLTWDIPWVKGLKLKGQVSYDNWGNYWLAVRKSYNLYNYDEATDTYSVAQKMNSPASIENWWRNYNRLNYQGQLSYDNTFNDQHHVGAMLATDIDRNWWAEARVGRQYDFFTNPQINQASTTVQTTEGRDDESRSASLIGRFNYDFRSKYLIEFSFRYNGSYRYAPSERWGFFPVISGGWRLSEENFIKNNVPWLTNLKLRASWGQVGEDAGRPYQYIPAFTTSDGGAYEFTNGSATEGAKAPGLVNEHLTWFTSTITDVGIDIGLFNKIDIEFDYYHRLREGLLARRSGSLPNTFGATLPEENLNSDIVKGFDMTLGFHDRWGDWTFGAKANMNLARQMFDYRERAPFTSSYDYWRNGEENRYKGVGWGYKLNGRFQNWEDLATSVPQNGGRGNTGSDQDWNTELPGDYKLLDVNENGVIDDRDQLPIFWHSEDQGNRASASQPKLFYGITLQAAWKGFDINMLFQGSAKNSARYYEVYGEMFAFRANTPAYFHDRWHLADPYNEAGVFGEWVPGEWPANRANDRVGRLYTETSVWRRNAAYFRFKNVELGYSLPSRITQNWGIQNLRFYVNASNVFTICDDFLKAFDPEKAEGEFGAGFTYPLMRGFNIGVNLTF